MDFNIGAKRENVKMLLKEQLAKDGGAELRCLMDGKNLKTEEDILNFKILQKEALKFRMAVHDQDILENLINEDYLKREAILSKMDDHVQLLKLKVQRRSKLQEKVARDLQTMNLKEIGEELEYLREELSYITYIIEIMCPVPLVAIDP